MIPVPRLPCCADGDRGGVASGPRRRPCCRNGRPGRLPPRRGGARDPEASCSMPSRSPRAADIMSTCVRRGLGPGLSTSRARAITFPVARRRWLPRSRRSRRAPVGRHRPHAGQLGIPRDGAALGRGSHRPLPQPRRGRGDPRRMLSNAGATGGRPSAAITRPAMPIGRPATASGSSASGPVSRRSGSSRMRSALQPRFLLATLGLWSGRRGRRARRHLR